MHLLSILHSGPAQLPAHWQTPLSQTPFPLHCGVPLQTGYSIKRVSERVS